MRFPSENKVQQLINGRMQQQRDHLPPHLLHEKRRIEDELAKPDMTHARREELLAQMVKYNRGGTR